MILVPRPTPFCSLVCIDNITWKQKSGEKWGRPEKFIMRVTSSGRGGQPQGSLNTVE